MERFGVDDEVEVERFAPEHSEDIFGGLHRHAHQGLGGLADDMGRVADIVEGVSGLIRRF